MLISYLLFKACNHSNYLRALVRYLWNGKEVEDNEVMMVIKTTGEAYSRLESHVKGMHPYGVPEIIGLKITAGSQSYLDWVTTSCPAQIN